MPSRPRDFWLNYNEILADAIFFQFEGPPQGGRRSILCMHHFAHSAFCARGEAPQLSIALDQVATIIDGQHRLKGLEEAGKPEFELPISIFIGADEATEASIFSIVNLAQTKVNKSLAYDLFE
jgi:DGQHR domain-containing protein